MAMYEADKAQYFMDVVRQWRRAVMLNDFQTVTDAQRSLVRMGAVYNGQEQAWEYDPANEEAHV